MKFFQASIHRQHDIYRCLFVKDVGNPLKIRVDNRQDMGGQILRLPVAPIDAARLEGRCNTKVDPRALILRHQVYSRARSRRIDKILAGLPLSVCDVTLPFDTPIPTP